MADKREVNFPKLGGAKPTTAALILSIRHRDFWLRIIGFALIRNSGVLEAEHVNDNTLNGSKLNALAEEFEPGNTVNVSPPAGHSAQQQANALHPPPAMPHEHLPPRMSAQQQVNAPVDNWPLDEPQRIIGDPIQWQPPTRPGEVSRYQHAAQPPQRHQEQYENVQEYSEHSQGPSIAQGPPIAFYPSAQQGAQSQAMIYDQQARDRRNSARRPEGMAHVTLSKPASYNVDHVLRHFATVANPQILQIFEPKKLKFRASMLRFGANLFRLCTNPFFCVATVQKIVTEILPPSSGLAFGKDARDLLIECCVEFITLISSEANEISEKESKKTIACEHITKALEQLGFGDYVHDIMEVASEHKEQLKGREKKANKLEQSGLSTEQLLAMQEEAFRDAAQRHG
ncbi:Negative cofactor 2 complex subunit beta [Lachnellula suecica]|uniref:NCT transcriptional regulatory complex subunit B n=1 Tax=Lachnellula suecica TaxID=602035 RepID=A0A8T9C492_9HELO|nr:Negative cofactor 2 complex subunit beta [Lachnellula suecica]